MFFIKPVCGRKLPTGAYVHVVILTDGRIKRNPLPNILPSSQSHGRPDNTLVFSGTCYNVSVSKSIHTLHLLLTIKWQASYQSKPWSILSYFIRGGGGGCSGNCHLGTRVPVSNKLCASHSSTVYFNHFSIFISLKKSVRNEAWKAINWIIHTLNRCCQSILPMVIINWFIYNW